MMMPMAHGCAAKPLMQKIAGFRAALLPTLRKPAAALLYVISMPRGLFSLLAAA